MSGLRGGEVGKNSFSKENWVRECLVTEQSTVFGVKILLGELNLVH